MKEKTKLFFFVFSLVVELRVCLLVASNKMPRYNIINKKFSNLHLSKNFRISLESLILESLIRLDLMWRKDSVFANIGCVALIFEQT